MERFGRLIISFDKQLRRLCAAFILPLKSLRTCVAFMITYEFKKALFVKVYSYAMYNIFFNNLSNSVAFISRKRYK